MTRIGALIVVVFVAPQFANGQEGVEEACMHDISYGPVEPGLQGQGLIRARQLGFLPTDWRELYDRSDGTHIRATRFRRDADSCGGLQASGDVVVMVREGGSEVTMKAEELRADWNCVPPARLSLIDLAEMRQRLWGLEGYCPQIGDAPVTTTSRSQLTVDDRITVAAATFNLESETGAVSAEGGVTAIVTLPEGYTITMHADHLTIERALTDYTARGWAVGLD